MKPVLITYLFLTLFQFAFGQHKMSDSALNKSSTLKIRFVDPPSCNEIDNWAKSDIARKHMFLFLQGGLAPTFFPSDSTFENKYNIYFYDFGCVGFNDYTCVIKYDSEIFDYLTATYGKSWMRKIRKDVIGFKEWKKQYKKARH